MPLFLGVGVDLGARPFLEPRQIARRDRDGRASERMALIDCGDKPQLAHEAADRTGSPNKPGVNHHTGVAVGQQVAAPHDAADGVNFAGIARTPFVARPPRT